MVLCGVPVCVSAQTVQNKARHFFPQRVLAGRAIRGYRTVSTDATCALTKTLPWDLEEEVFSEVYRRVVEFRAENVFCAPPVEGREQREAAHRRVMVRWSARLEAPRASFAIVEALQRGDSPRGFHM